MAIRKEFWRLAWPAAAEGLLLMLLTAADLLMVSALGNTAVAAVSIFSQPRMVILCVTRSYSVALSAYVARRRGKHPDESLTSCSRASLMLGCGLSMLLLVGTWIGAGPLLRLAGAQDDYINLGLQYAFPTLVSLALSGPAIVLHGILAGLGDTKSVLVSNVLGNGVNVVFNALLIYGLGPFPQLGVFGAGLGTAIGAGATLLYLLLRSPLLQFYHLEGNDLALGCEIMIFVAAVNIPEAWAMVHAGLLRGLGHTSFVALYSLISIAVVRPILTFFLVYELGLGLYGAWIALTLDQATRAVCSMLGAQQTIRTKMKDGSNS